MAAAGSARGTCKSGLETAGRRTPCRAPPCPARAAVAFVPPLLPNTYPGGRPQPPVLSPIDRPDPGAFRYTRAYTFPKSAKGQQIARPERVHFPSAIKDEGGQGGEDRGK
ncbi:unnamed protein product, partial [Iphiclides podalirius]